MMLIAQLGI